MTFWAESFISIIVWQHDQCLTDDEKNGAIEEG
jgi:hypothetical protein